MIKKIIALLAGAAFMMTLNSVNIAVGNTTVPVPEPGAIILLGLGVLALAIYGRSRMNGRERSETLKTSE